MDSRKTVDQGNGLSRDISNRHSPRLDSPLLHSIDPSSCQFCTPSSRSTKEVGRSSAAVGSQRDQRCYTHAPRNPELGPSRPPLPFLPASLQSEDKVVLHMEGTTPEACHDAVQTLPMQYVAWNFTKLAYLQYPLLCVQREENQRQKCVSARC